MSDCCESCDQHEEEIKCLRYDLANLAGFVAKLCGTVPVPPMQITGGAEYRFSKELAEESADVYREVKS